MGPFLPPELSGLQMMLAESWLFGKVMLWLATLTSKVAQALGTTERGYSWTSRGVSRLWPPWVLRRALRWVRWAKAGVRQLCQAQLGRLGEGGTLSAPMSELGCLGSLGEVAPHRRAGGLALYSPSLHDRPPRQSWPVSAQQFRVREGYSLPALEKFPTWVP